MSADFIISIIQFCASKKQLRFLYKLTTLIKICSTFVQEHFIDMASTEQFTSSSTVKGQGRSKYYKMLDQAKQGELIQIRRGIYATSEQLSGNMIDINAIVKNGILC